MQLSDLRSSVCVCPPVRLSNLVAARHCCRFAAVGPAGRRCRSIAAAAAGECGQMPRCQINKRRHVGGWCIFQTDIKKQEWWGAGVSGVVICLEPGADLHVVQLMPLPLTISCFSKIQIGFTFLVPAYLGSPGKRPLNGCVCVCGILLYKNMQLATMRSTAWWCSWCLQSATTMRSTTWWCSWCCSRRRRCVLLPGGVHGVAVGDDDAFYYLVVFMVSRLLVGAGSSPIISVGVTYIDDCSTTQKFATYAGNRLGR